MARQTGEQPQIVTFTLNGTPVTARADETILQAAQRHGVEIPRLCYTESLRADGNCRACLVEIDGERTLAPSCCRRPSQGMVVQSRSERALQAQKLVLELLQSDMPHDQESYTLHSELDDWCDKLGVTRYRFPARNQPAPDSSHPAIAVRLDACIQCGRCLRACRETQANDGVGFFGRGSPLQVGFERDHPIGPPSCVGRRQWRQGWRA